MAYPSKRSLNRIYLAESTTSMATTPVAMSFMVPDSGYLREIVVATTGTTTGTITVAVTQNSSGTDLASGGLTIAAGAGFVPSTFVFPMAGASAVSVAAGDIITLTPSGGTGASIGGAATVILAK